jgi:hypothetical protein
MKPGNLLLMVLVLLLGTAVAAPAVTLHTPWGFEAQEQYLSQIISDWGFAVDNNALQHTTPLEILPAGLYSIGHYAIDPGKAQPRSTYPLAIMLPGRGGQLPADGIRLLIPQKSGNWECDLPLPQPRILVFELPKRKSSS